MLSALNVPTHQSYSSHSQETPLYSQDYENDNSHTGERYITDEGKLMYVCVEQNLSIISYQHTQPIINGTKMLFAQNLP